MKEKSDKDMRIRIPLSMHKKFKVLCDKKYKTVSGTIKELILKYIENRGI